MKLSIDKIDLQRGLARLQAIVEKRSSMPILANVADGERKERERSARFSAHGSRGRIRGSQPAKVAAWRADHLGRKLMTSYANSRMTRSSSSRPATAYLDIRWPRSLHLAAPAPRISDPPDFRPAAWFVSGSSAFADDRGHDVRRASSSMRPATTSTASLRSRAGEREIRMVATDGHRLHS
jgi:hypothetical protein